MNSSRTQDEPEQSPVRVETRNGFVIVHDTRDSSSPPLRFSVKDWAVFLDGVRRGEFDIPAHEASAGTLPEPDPPQR
jgi:hypothetical protein